MKNSLIFLFIITLCSGCDKKISASDLSKINGYWEIEKVILENGTEKDYTINQSYDYFEVRDNAGFKKKVAPQLDGTFIVNDDFEKVEIKQEGGKYFILYSTNYAKWKEELSILSDNRYVTINGDRSEYYYKRAGALNIIDNGKKNK